MPKLPECDRCLLYARDPHLVCAVHPMGLDTDSCIDFRPDPNAETEELWEPEGASYYAGELILHRPTLTREDQWQILDNHPFFTGVCPVCNYQFPSHVPDLVHFDCPTCGWIDDSV
jgi:hypothetical protein